MMFSSRIPLFSLLGFRINIDVSWFFLAFYLVLSLSRSYFPSVLPHQVGGTYLLMGIFGALGLFLSIVLHELAHAAVARGFGLPIGGITLFIFGGVAELRQEPKTPRSEFWVAIAGPIASIAIASLCFLARYAAEKEGLAQPAAVLAFLTITNTILALFNLVPAFPLDGGRILRSILWWRTGNLRRATRIASAFGSAFGVVLMATGFLQIISGNALGGTWQLLIGLFLTFAASQSRSQTETVESLRGVRVADLMNRAPVSVPPGITVDELVHDYIYRHSCKFVIVAEDGKAFGYIGPKQIRRVPRSQWSETYARAITASFTHDTAISPDARAIDALRKLQTNGVGHLAVLDSSTLVGSLSESDFANYLSVREELAPISDKT